ncbi:MAG: FHA domain-containing protein [Actinomycetota bacterium]|nr:FHA domain-containing protein [Actinomycetota bacterium]
MSTVECPSGHQSTDPEWCDTCGAKIGGAAAVVPPAAPTPAPAAGSSAPPMACPHCSEQNPSDALFCEVCGYDFTTGQAPPSAAAEPAPSVEPHVDLSVNWIVVVEVSPAWFDLKGALADAPCPPASSSTVPLTNHTALIGRSSASRGVRPELTLDADTGVSRRHAQFVRNGEMLTVVDLSSTNGTYVVPAGEEPSDATQSLVPGVPTELADGDRVFLGAWTSLTVRSSPA